MRYAHRLTQLSAATLPGLVVALGLSTMSHAATMEEIRERGVMNIATEDNYAPFNMMEGNEPTGFTSDVVAELRDYADFEISQDILPWSGLLSSVLSGRYDAAITGAIVSEERLRVFDFSVPTATAQHYYIKRADDDRIQGVSDLDGLTVGVQAGSVLLSRLPELETMLEETGGSLGEVVEYTSYPEIYEDLANGRLDYSINSIISAQSLVDQRGDEFALGEPVSGPGFYAYPVPQENDQVLAFINDFVRELRDSGRLAELQQEWFGLTFPDLPDQPITSVEEFREMTGTE